MRTLAIYGTEGRVGTREALRRLFEMVAPYYEEIYLERTLFTFLSSRGFSFSTKVRKADHFPENASIVVSIGGDGTFLRAAQWVGKREIPIVGLNAGHLGFLASYSLDEVDELAGLVCRGEGKVEKRMVLEASFPGMENESWPYALNEVSIVKSATASMLWVRAYIGGRFVADYLSDGLVVSSPTGSTAYNLAVGGPILSPTLESMILSPIAAHSLTMRPLVVGADEILDFEIYSRAGECLLALDGRTCRVKCRNPRVVEASGAETGRGEPLLRVRRSDFSVSILRRPDSDFPTLLREKLLWGRR